MTAMNYAYPQYESVVRYVSIAAALCYLAIIIGANARRGRLPKRPTWPLTVWSSVAMITFHLLLDFFYWRLAVWTISFAGQFAALVFLLVLAISWHRADKREWAGNPSLTNNK
jgi:hypothetical protein